MSKIKNLLPLAVALLFSCNKEIVQKKATYSSGKHLVGVVIITKEQFKKFIKNQEDSCKCKIKF